jgi:hypothetical protein
MVSGAFSARANEEDRSDTKKKKIALLGQQRRAVTKAIIFIKNCRLGVGVAIVTLLVVTLSVLSRDRVPNQHLDVIRS